MNRTKIINIVSGKGGTGKTLLTAVLAEMLGNDGYKVVVVDMDVFVRGLTSLLYFHKKEIVLANDNELTVSEIFMDKGDFDISGKSNLSIARYRSFDVIPSVSRVDELLEFKDLMPDTKQEARSIISAMIGKIPNDYDLILLDSRAGYDELIASTHALSDISICIEEEDDISKITSDNLIKQLQEDADNPLFRLTNKAQKDSYTDKEENIGISNLGKIPFDMDVMRSFGGKSFWIDINKTLYKSALGRAWNNLSTKMGLGIHIEIIRNSPIGSESVEKKLQLYSITDRIFILYGLIIGFFGILYGLFGLRGITNLIFNEQSLALITGLIGFGMSAYFIIFKKKR